MVAASGGNFGLAVGHAARELGHRAEIFVPSTSPVSKIDRVRATGAEVRVIDGLLRRCVRRPPRERQDATGAVWMHPFDQPEVVAGQGTIGLELSEQVPDADTVLVSVGGGGLIGGIASWFASEVARGGRRARDLHVLGSALEAGEPVDVAVRGIAADSLGARRVGDIAFAVAREHVGRCVTVSDDAIREAQRAIWRELHLLAEPGGAAALAALMAGAYRPRSRRTGRRPGVRRQRRPCARDRRLERADRAPVGSPAVTNATDFDRAFAFQRWVLETSSTRSGRAAVGHGVLPRRVPAEVRRQHGLAGSAARRPRRWQRSTT